MNIIEIFRNYNPRLKVVSYLLGVLLIVLGSGLAYRQIYEYQKYSKKEERQNLRRIILPGPRGNIYDRDGRLIVGNRPRYSAVVFLNELRPGFRQEFRDLRKKYSKLPKDEQPGSYDIQIEARSNVVQKYIDQVGEAIGRKVEVSPRKVEKHFYQQLLLPFPLIEDMEPEEYALLVEQIPVQSAIQIYTSNTRYYPYGSLASHTIGYVSNTEDISTLDLPGEQLMTFKVKGFTGRTGLEKGFNKHLEGESGLEIWVVDPSGFQYESVEHKSPVKGNDLKVTIDSELQDIAEMALGDKQGALVALDVKRGDLLVMASKPDYNLNDLSPFIPTKVFNDINERGAWMNNALQGTFAPGSTFKVVTALAGLRAGLIDDQSSVYCSGSYRVGNRTFKCWNHLGHGEVNLHEAIKHSCNVFFYKYSQEIGVDRISEEAIRFDFNQPTNIELPDESNNMLVPTRDWKMKNRHESWFPGNTAHLAIGQGFLRVTPLQMASFTAAFARKETHFQPTILFDPFRQVVPSKNDIGISDSDYHKLVNAMEDAAADGTAKLLQIPGVRIAAKTGTAQVQTPKGMKHLAWSICYAPIEDPEIAIAVVVIGKDVGDSLGGGSTACPIAKPVLERFFQKMGHVATVP